MVTAHGTHTNTQVPHFQLVQINKVASQSSNKAITDALEAVLELLRARRRPGSSIRAGHGIRSLETNVKNIVRSVAVVAIQTLVGEAQLPEGQRRLAGRREAVGVAPDTVELGRQHFYSINVMRRTSWSLQTTAMILRGSMPWSCGSNEGEAPSFPKTTNECRLASRSSMPYVATVSLKDVWPWPEGSLAQSPAELLAPSQSMSRLSYSPSPLRNTAPGISSQ